MSEKGAFGQGALRLLCKRRSCSDFRPLIELRRDRAVGLSVGADSQMWETWIWHTESSTHRRSPCFGALSRSV